ncbi:MAG: hypothetical protein C0467_09260 [Planctomycetaceae bacterium]|nr:hypothetical protein [Planctomycetaceae bacterium]
MSSVRFAAYLVMVPVAALVAKSSWAKTVVVSTFSTRSSQDEIESELAFGQHLDVVDLELRRQIQIKDALLDELIAGRTTLAAVTDRFLVLNQSQPASLAVIRKEYPGATDEEKTARNVIGFAEAELSKYPPTQKAEVLARLEAQFRQSYPAPVSDAFPACEK